MKRILFVDDEPRLLEGLQRLLRPRRKEWDMAFATGGEEALEMLASAPFDVIVTDMRMPVMDGARLLEQVQVRFPGVIRIVLSGYFEMDAALRAAPVAHQFLSKPCDPEKLREAIDRACGCAALLGDETVRRVVGTVGSLPSLPATCAALLAALQDPDVALDRIGHIIEQDVGMTAKILQLVNSAFFGRPCEVTTVTTAVSFLGLDVLRQLVLSVEIFQTFRPARAVSGFSLRQFELHSLLAAKLAARLPAPKATAAVAVVAALLHDTGKLVLAARLPEEFGRAIETATAKSVPLHAAEQELTGTTHAEIGAYLLGLWGLPRSIVDAVFRHHRPSASQPGSGELDALAVTHIADALAFETAQGVSAGAPAGCALLDTSYLEELGVAQHLADWRKLASQAFQEQAENEPCETLPVRRSCS